MRIISGDYGGRPLESLPGQETRPTSDQLKETVFNIIGPYFKGGKVLDLYAGTGALGIEAVSRGMDQAILIDSNKEAINIISKNIKMTKEEYKFESIHSKAHYALNILASRDEKFSLVFLDPPYLEEKVAEDIHQLVEKKLLADTSVLVCEVGKDVVLPEEIGKVKKWDQRDYRNKIIVIYQKLNENTKGAK